MYKKAYKIGQLALWCWEVYWKSSGYMAHCSRWYTPDFHVVTTDIQAFVPMGHQDLYPGTEKNCVKCL